MTVSRILMAAAAAALMASPALANGPSATPLSPKMHHHRAGFFGKIDTNQDGKISRDEWTAHQAAVFDKIDADHDGSLTKAEFKAEHEKMKAKHADWHERHGRDSTAESPENHGGSDGVGGWTAQ
jgi:hypothetical protein